jgi:hypothetical protein
MPNIMEMQIIQKGILFDLLLVKKANPNKSIKGLSRLISKTKSGMSKEDIAFVEQLIDQEDDL